MFDLRWLDTLPRPASLALVGATSGAALVGTLAPADGAASLGIAAVVMGSFFAAHRLLARRSVATDPLSDRDRGILARRALKMVEDDPSFSLPDVAETLRSTLLPTKLGGPVELGPVVRVPPSHDTPDTLELVVAYRTPATTGVGRAVLGRHGEDWVLRRFDQPVDLPDDLPHPSPWLAANRRVLLARSEAFDLPAFEALVEHVNALLDDPATDDAALRPWATPTGLSSVRWWSARGGLPAAEGPIEWVAVLEDAWYERVDLRAGDRVLGLLRRAGAPAEPWRLWRIRSAGGAR